MMLCSKIARLRLWINHQGNADKESGNERVTGYLVIQNIVFRILVFINILSTDPFVDKVKNLSSLF